MPSRKKKQNATDGAPGADIKPICAIRAIRGVVLPN
jgi:hypothetical protein